MEIVQLFDNQVPLTKRLAWAEIGSSTYFYTPKSGNAGRKPSSYTLHVNGSIVSNEIVSDEIKNILDIEFLCYGYLPVTKELQERGYLINKKKVYRLMKQDNLLFGKKISVHAGKRKFVQFRKISASSPMQYLNMDIKYIRVNNKFAYLLSVIDVYSRKIIGYLFKQSIKQKDVLHLLKSLLPEKAKIPITLRNDNGSQFIASSVRNYLQEVNVIHEFTHIATPEENAYIESWHSIVERELTSRYEFESFYHAEMKITQYIFTYNNIRKHGSLQYRTPAAVWNEHFNSLSSDKPNAAGKPEDLSRFFEEKFLQLNFSSKIHTNLDKSVGGAKFDYLMANEFIFNYICKNSQSVFEFYSN